MNYSGVTKYKEVITEQICFPSDLLPFLLTFLPSHYVLHIPIQIPYSDGNMVAAHWLPREFASLKDALHTKADIQNNAS